MMLSLAASPLLSSHFVPHIHAELLSVLRREEKWEMIQSPACLPIPNHSMYLNMKSGFQEGIKEK